MTPTQRLLAKLLLIILVLGAVFFAGFAVRGYMADKQATETENKQLVEALNQVADYQDQVAARDKQNQELQNKLTTLDQEQTNARQAALDENAALRRDLAVAQRMRLKGTSCPRVPSGTEAGTTAGVDHEPQVELSDETRLAVFDLRESIIQDQAALEGCRAYVRQLGLYP